MKIKQILNNLSTGVAKLYTIIFSYDKRLEAIETSLEVLESTLIALLKKYDSIAEVEKHLFKTPDKK